MARKGGSFYFSCTVTVERVKTGDPLEASRKKPEDEELCGLPAPQQIRCSESAYITSTSPAIVCLRLPLIHSFIHQRDTAFL